MATHSSILACRIPWTEEPDGLQSMGLQRVGQDWVTNTFFSLLLFVSPAFLLFLSSPFLLSSLLLFCVHVSGCLSLSHHCLVFKKCHYVMQNTVLCLGDHSILVSFTIFVISHTVSFILSLKIEEYDRAASWKRWQTSAHGHQHFTRFWCKKCYLFSKNSINSVSSFYYCWIEKTGRDCVKVFTEKWSRIFSFHKLIAETNFGDVIELDIASLLYQTGYICTVLVGF